MPAGEEPTVPAPLPSLETVSACIARPKVAVTVAAAETVSVHGPVPEQPPPDQPLNDEPVAGVAVRVTIVPASKLSEQSAPQSMPAGAELTVPLPAPVLITASACCCTVKVAVTCTGAVTVTLQLEMP